MCNYLAQDHSYSNRKQFGVMLRVVNASDKPQAFEVMVDWVTSWRISNTQILWAGEAGNRFGSNFAVQKRLEPGEAYEQPAELAVDRDPGTAVISFQMGFSPVGEKKISWSNRVVLGIIPNKQK